MTYRHLDIYLCIAQMRAGSTTLKPEVKINPSQTLFIQSRASDEEERGEAMQQELKRS